MIEDNGISPKAETSRKKKQGLPAVVSNAFLLTVTSTVMIIALMTTGATKIKKCISTIAIYFLLFPIACS